MDEDILMAELVVDLDGVFQKGLRSFGILPKQICEDRSLSEIMPISLHDESEARWRGKALKGVFDCVPNCLSRR